MTPRLPELSRQQERVLQGLAQGLELRAVARDLEISYGTARGYLAAARDRLGAVTTAQAVAIYVIRDRVPA